MGLSFSEIELSILDEVGNQTVGGAASSLSDFADKRVVISIPTTKILTFKELKHLFEPAVIYTKVDYKEGMSGSNLLLMKKEEAKEFTNSIIKEKLGKGPSEWDDFSKGVLTEVFNIMAGKMSSGMADIFHRSVDIKPPEIYEKKAEELDLHRDEEELVTIWFELKIQDIMKIKLIKIIKMNQAKEMIHLIKGDLEL